MKQDNLHQDEIVAENQALVHGHTKPSDLLFNEEFTALASKGFTPHEFKSLLIALSKPPRTSYIRVDLTKFTLIEAKLKLQALIDLQCIEKGWDIFFIGTINLPDVLYLNARGLLKIDPVECEVIVDIPCANAVLRGADVFAVGIFAAQAPMLAGDTVAVYVDLDGNCLRGQKVKYTGQKVFLGNGICLKGREDVFRFTPKELKGLGIGIKMTQPIYQSPCLSDISSLWLYLQNLPSILVGHALDVKEHHVILDMCACPGGKTIHIANLTKNKSTLIALDRSRQKITQFTKIIKEKNLCIKAYCCDATSCVLPRSESTSFTLDNLPQPGSKIAGLSRESFDRILLDGPCSALGQRGFGSNGEVLLRNYASYQRSLLESAYHLLKVGGRMVYSTCTFTIDENEMNVVWFLHEFKNMKIVEKCGDVNWRLGQGSRIEGVEGVCRFDPHVALIVEGVELDSIGFFFSVFEKMA